MSIRRSLAPALALTLAACSTSRADLAQNYRFTGHDTTTGRTFGGVIQYGGSGVPTGTEPGGTSVFTSPTTPSILLLSPSGSQWMGGGGEAIRVTPDGGLYDFLISAPSGVSVTLRGFTTAGLPSDLRTFTSSAVVGGPITAGVIDTLQTAPEPSTVVGAGMALLGGIGYAIRKRKRPNHSSPPSSPANEPRFRLPMPSSARP